MALPTMKIATHELTVPSTGQKVEFRPFLVKEEKAMLMAVEDGSPKALTNAMKNIITACTYGDIDLKTLAAFDFDYIFLQLRGKSVGDVVELHLKKPEQITCEDNGCPKASQIEVDIRDIEMDISKIEKPEIELTDEIGIKLNFPDLELVQKFIKPGGDLATNDIFNLINECIEYIWDGDEIFKAKDATRKELTDFVESLSTEQFTKIRNYFESMPRLRHEITWKCPKCDKTAPLVLEGLDSFFG